VFGLGSTSFHIVLSTSTSELDVLTAKIRALAICHEELQASIGQDLVDIEGVEFKALSQVTVWIVNNLLSESYHVFMEIHTLLNMLGMTMTS